MMLRSMIVLATILSGAVSAITGAWAQASLAVPGVVFDRPSAVQDMIARLRTVRPFEAIDDKPHTCWAVPNTPSCGCRYLPGDLWINVVWSRYIERPSSVWIRKVEPLSAAPFAWTDLAASFHRLCPGLTAEQAAAVASEALDKMLHERWMKCEESLPLRCGFVSRETDGASRGVLIRDPEGTGRVRERGSCSLHTRETTRGGAIVSSFTVETSHNVPPDLSRRGC
jgi:hypothetical protein